MSQKLLDIEKNEIQPGDILNLNFGIPPTTVTLLVFGDVRAEHLHVIDGKGWISTLDHSISNNSMIKHLKD